MKLVVYGTKWIGDAVMTVPAIRELRRLYPSAELTLYSSRWAKGVFEDCDFIDRVLSPEAEKPGLFSEAGVWRREKFDLAVLFPNSFRSALIARLGGAKYRAGYANEGRGFLLNKAVTIPVWKNTRHEVFYYLNLVEKLGSTDIKSEYNEANEPDIRIEVSEKRRDAARRALSLAGADTTRPVIGFGVGSQNSEAKRWPAASYAGLNDLLVEKLGATVVLLGSAKESLVEEEVIRRSGSQPIAMTGRTTLSEAVAVLAELDVFVSNDMGLAHVSSAVGTETVTIFGPTNPVTTRPLQASVLRREDVDCSPCMLRECPIDHRCMTRIHIDDVFQEINSKLTNIS